MILETVINNAAKFSEMSDEEIMEGMASSIGFTNISDNDSAEKVFKDERYAQARTDCVKNIVIK